MRRTSFADMTCSVARTLELIGDWWTLLVIREAFYGSRRFQYDGKGEALFGPYVKAFFLSLVTFGLYWFWFAAERVRYLREHTTVGGVRFDSRMTGGGLLGLAVTNILLIVFTMGLAIPWVLVRTLRFECENLVLRGSLYVAGAAPETDNVSAVGAELADALDIGAGFDGM